MLLLVAGLGALVASPAPATEKFRDAPAFSLEPSLLLEQARAFPVTEQEGVLVLFRESEYLFDAAGRVELHYRIVYRIASTHALRSWSLVTRSWSPWHQERPEIRARVVTADGEEHWLDPETLGEYTDSEAGPDVYDDTMTLRGPLPAIAFGSVVEEQHVIRDTRPVFDRGTAGSWVFDQTVPVQRTRLVLDAPASLPLRYRTHLLPDVRTTRHEEDGRLRVVFEHDRIDPRKTYEPLAPSDVAQRPVVRFSTGESWAAIASRYAEVVDGQIGDDDLDKTVRKALGRPAQADREGKIAALLEYVHQRVRYTGVEFGEQAIVPTSPQQTLDRRFGDCKDKSTLLVALLRQAGIDADVALLSVGPGEDVDPDLPGLGAFDHAIVRVEGTPEIWIDPTHRFARVGELPDQDQGRLALVANPRVAELTRTPVATSADNVLSEVREVFLAASGGARIVETSSLTGSFERGYRSVYTDRGASTVREHLENYVKVQYQAEKLGNLEISKLDDLSEPLTLSVEAVQARRAWTTPSEAWVVMPLGALFRSLPEALRSVFDEEGHDEEEASAPLRQNDLVLEQPYVHLWRYVIHPPAGYALAEMPESDRRKIGPALLERTFEVAEDGTVVAELRFDTAVNRFTPEQVRQAREALSRLYVEKAPRVAFQQIGEAHLEAGRVREALGEFLRLVEANPGEATYRTQVARAYLAAGLGGKARGEARTATELDPTSAVAWRTLGTVLAHDELGRKFVAGFDRAAAVAALEQARKLDDEDFEARGELAILLEHDADGVRYADRAALDQAIAIYRSVRKELDDEGLTTNLMVDLMYAERFDELVELAREAPRSAARDGLRLVGIAALEGAAAAVAEASRIASGADEYRRILISAGEWILRVRRYAEAATLIAAGAKGAPEAVERLAMADLFARTRRYETLDASSQTPEGAVRGLLIALVADDRDAARALLATEPFDDDLASSFVEKLADDLRGLEWNLGRWGVTRESVLDVLLSLGRLSVEGTCDAACHVRLSFVGAPGAAGASTGFFLVREGSAYRIAGTDELRTPAAKLILDWLDDDKLEPAALWLDAMAAGIAAMPGGDPLLEHPLRRLWGGAVPREVGRGRIAAASLVDHPSAAGRAAEILESAFTALGEDEDPGGIALALATVAGIAERDELRLTAARRLYAANPRSMAAFQGVFSALVELRRFDDAEREILERAERIPGDPAIESLGATLAMLSDDLPEWRKRLGRMISSGRAAATDYNNLAWLDICEGRLTPDTLANAQQAVVMDRYSEPASLHTLATVYAELGRVTEARDVLLQLLENRTTGDLESPDWYVLGRIAESYGVLDAAQDAYRKVERDEADMAQSTSTHALAARRLAELSRD